LARHALGRADILWRCRKNVVAHAHLHMTRHTCNAALQTGIRVALAGAPAAAVLAAAGPPQRKGIAIAALLFDGEARSEFDRAQPRLALFRACDACNMASPTARSLRRKT
jgi:hypothetical protein